MPVIRLKLSAAWYKSIQGIAERRGLKIDELLLESIASSYPKPRTNPAWFEDEVAARRAAEFCDILQTTKSEILAALKRLEPPARSNPDVVARRARLWSQRHKIRLCLRTAMKSRNLTQRDVAKSIGVCRQAVSAVLVGRAPLPPAWHDGLMQLLGDDWMSE